MIIDVLIDTVLAWTAVLSVFGVIALFMWYVFVHWNDDDDEML